MARSELHVPDRMLRERQAGVKPDPDGENLEGSLLLEMEQVDLEKKDTRCKAVLESEPTSVLLTGCV